MVYATPKPEPKPGLIAAAYTSPVVASAFSAPYTAPFVYSTGYLAPSFYNGAYRAYPAYSAPLVL
jgi:hypothetical protein